MSPRPPAMFLLLVLPVVVLAQHEHHRVNVDVYYESLCPDSIKFFTQQLYPSLQGNLSQFVNLTLLPFGKSKITDDITNEFICHHGPAECRGNRIQVCALHLIEKGSKSEGLGYNRISVAFINCLMAKVKPSGNATTFPTQDCAQINQVGNLAEIENCSNDPDGSKYLKQVGEVTGRLNPPLTSVPTIVFNGKYKKDDDDLAKSNFVKALCQYIHGEKPGECSKNGAGTFGVGLWVLPMVALMFRKF